MIYIAFNLTLSTINTVLFSECAKSYNELDALQ